MSSDGCCDIIYRQCFSTVFSHEEAIDPFKVEDRLADSNGMTLETNGELLGRKEPYAFLLFVHCKLSIADNLGIRRIGMDRPVHLSVAGTLHVIHPHPPAATTYCEFPSGKIKAVWFERGEIISRQSLFVNQTYKGPFEGLGRFVDGNKGDRRQCLLLIFDPAPTGFRKK